MNYFAWEEFLQCYFLSLYNWPLNNTDFNSVVHLYMDFSIVNMIILHDLQLVESVDAELQMQRNCG